MTRIFICASALFFAGSAPLYASELVHEFNSPTFGGNPNYSAHRQYIASSNNQHQDDNTLSTQDSIADLVKRSVSFQLANNINAAIFGDSALANGTSFLGDGSSITWSRNGSLVTVTFTGVDGSTTSFIVPD